MKQRLSDIFGIAGVVAAAAGTVGVASTVGVAGGALSGAFLFTAAFAYLGKDGAESSQEQEQENAGKRGGHLKEMIALGLVGAALGGTLGTMIGCVENEKQCAPYIPRTIPIFTKQ